MLSFADQIRAKFVNVERSRDDMHDYQRAAVEFLKENPFSALFIDLGLGKTCISLTAIIDLLSNFEIERALVIAPLRVANETWPTEIALWSHTAALSYKHLRSDDVVKAVNAAGIVARKEAREKNLSEDVTKNYIADARRKQSRLAVRRQFEESDAVVHIIHREQVEFLVEAWGKDWPYDTVIIDESSSLKDHRTKRFKALARVRPLMVRMHQLTATPAAESYIHLFAQIYLLDLGSRFGKAFTKFTERYFTYNKWSMKYKLREGAEREIVDKISDICLTLKASDYLDLQEPVAVMHEVVMSSDVESLYDTMEREFIVELPDGSEVEAETAAALSQKLLQMASGVLYETIQIDKGDGSFAKARKVHRLHDLKIEKLKELEEQANGEPLLVAYHFESSLDRLKAAFPHAAVMDREGKCVAKWNKGQIPMLLVHPQSAGHGLNLQHGGHHIVFFDIPWSLELYLQLIGRLARQGQKLTVIVHHLITKGTLDALVVKALREKKDAQEVLFRLLKRRQRVLRLRSDAPPNCEL